MGRTHRGEEADEEAVRFEGGAVADAHDEAVARFVIGMRFGVRRNPAALLEISPLCFVLV
jgi:hypothetical protein